MSIRIPLDEQLGSGQYVEIRDPRKLSWGQQKAIAKAFGDSETPSTSAQFDAAEEVASTLISAGYVLDADSKPIMFPVSKESIDSVPSVVVEEVIKKFAEVRKESSNTKNS